MNKKIEKEWNYGEDEITDNGWYYYNMLGNAIHVSFKFKDACDRIRRG